MITKFIKESFFSAPKQQVFQFHERPDAFRVLTPSWDNIDIISTASTLRISEDIVRFVAKFLFLRFKFAMKHTVYEPFDLFVDEQQEGLFSFWRHEHRFVEAGWKSPDNSILADSGGSSSPEV